MGREDWISIGVQKELVKKLDDFLKTKKAKELGIKNRQQIIGLILKEFLEKGLDMFEKEKEIQKITKERNTASNMVDMIGKGLIGSNDVENLKHEKISNEKIIIRDKKLRKSIEVNITGEMPYCTYHNANWCNHIGYVFYLSMMASYQRELKTNSNRAT